MAVDDAARAVTEFDLLPRLRRTQQQLRSELLAARGGQVHWTGQLSASALSTATAVSAMSIVLETRLARRQPPPAAVKHFCLPTSTPQQLAEAASQPAVIELRELIRRGAAWLLTAANRDGGFGDTDRSHSNIATSMLVAAALKLAAPQLSEVDQEACQRVAADLNAYIERSGSIAALKARYGKDKTFVIPILTNCALAGMVPWSEVQALPFELAAVPQRMYRLMRMPVVSYAVPALVAIGQARLFYQPPRLPLLGRLRRLVVGTTMRVLQRMQPTSGGYLEATPLTAFVLMSLAATGRAEHPVSQNGLCFLRDSILDDGAWPIDTNLATWITSLSIHALASKPGDRQVPESQVPEGAGLLASGPETAEHVPDGQEFSKQEISGLQLSMQGIVEEISVDSHWADRDLVTWLLSCQHLQRHPFTGANPGGWGWTDLSGAVPDGDDTPAAIIALAEAQQQSDFDPELLPRIRQATDAGVGWLLRLQNRDGGWPTFCRGWGKLPFDRSSTDLTAHALRALFLAETRLGIDIGRHRGWSRAVRRGWRFLARSQRPDGSFLPLWFGNQDNPDDENPVYGTGRILLTAAAVGHETRGAEAKFREQILERAVGYLVDHQNADGGWGGGPSRAASFARREIVRNFDMEYVAKPNDVSSVEESRGSESSVEETAIAVEGLAIWLLSQQAANPAQELAMGSGAGMTRPEVVENGLFGGVAGALPAKIGTEVGGNLITAGAAGCRAAIIRTAVTGGAEFLCQAVRQSKHHDPWPIGFYFAKLWYHERLYPTVFTTAALGAAERALDSSLDRVRSS
ncbi:prenyltransferase/squalene oxidase repeat-containing protein [Planctomycetaceae bacterium SH139]